MIDRSATTPPPPSAPGPSALGGAIRALRTEVGITQVDFAAELGITPTSVYRYEAGISIPTSDILAKILQYAVDKQSPQAVQDLSEEIAKRTGLNLLESHHLSSDAPFIRALGTLRLEKRMLVMAAVAMLVSGPDPTETRIFEALLAPWIPKAKEQFGSPDLPFLAPTGQKLPTTNRKTQTKKSRRSSDFA